jgi:rubrerythrin
MGNLTYLLIAVAVLVAAFMFFRRRRRLTDAAPAEGTAFARFGPNIRLRDLFRLAIMIEEKGMALYLDMEKKALDPETKKLCAWLADEEADHRRFVQGYLDKWRPLPPHLTEWPAFMAKVKQEGFFSDPPAEFVSEDEMAAYAISQEAKSSEFYALFEHAFPGAWKQAKMHKLVEEERSHEARLRAAYPHIK